MDFLGSDHFNVDTCNDEPEEDDPFGFSFSSLGFAQFELGVDLADVCGVNAPKKPKFGRGGQMILEWRKCYLDSCASYHTFFIREFLKNINKGEATMTGRCNASTTKTKKEGLLRGLQGLVERERDCQPDLHPDTRSKWIHRVHSHQRSVESYHPRRGYYSFQA